MYYIYIYIYIYICITYTYTYIYIYIYICIYICIITYECCGSQHNEASSVAKRGTIAGTNGAQAKLPQTPTHQI